MRTWMNWMACAGVALLPMQVGAEEFLEQESQEVRSTVVLAHPGLTGQLGAGVEHAVGERVTLAATVTVMANFNDLRSDALGTGFSSTQWGLGLDPGVHFFLTGRAPEGLWVGPHLEVFGDYVTSRNDTVYPEASQSVESGWRSLTYGASARLGYTVILAPGLTAQLAVGITGHRNHTLASTPSADEGYLRSWSVAPRTTLAVGWAF
ncbi:DUF3575 domain-containing protein [Melittangium boletus]|uniref:Outer membrane protein beta-barrel domain-containing protein n=1 Tax=Melittangium boletus DSM 14713 TaxID=1294270 RepID=A0A250IG51_9BACT|nr:DUF3575 domain-containing protein [Melittangium boletus]ATB30131.1 hypothetical protein MEBOL_003586 [Melittangium boletus DSM 14713]